MPSHPAQQRLGRAPDLDRDGFHCGPLRGVIVAALKHQTNGALTHLGGKLRRLLHGSIFSRVGASTKPGAVHILLKLREAYPDAAELSAFLNTADQNTQANLYYLAEHGLVVAEAERKLLSGPQQMLTARITADGLDFLEDDGGLGAILKVVTVRMDAAEIRELLEARIGKSDIPDDKKKSALTKIQAFSGDVLKSIIIKMIEQGLEKPDQLWSLVNMIAKV